MRRKRREKAKAQEQAQEQAATAELAPGPPARRAVSAPVAPSSAGSNPPTGAPGAPVASMPDRVDALTEAIGGELGRLRGEIRGRDSDLVRALHQVAASYDRVAARLDDERRVQELLAEALVRIDRRLATIEGKGIDGKPTPPREELPRSQRVIGGSIAPRQDIPRIEH